MERNKLHSEIGEKAMELQILLDMAKALEKTFAADYIDVEEEDIIRAIGLDSETFRGVFDSMAYILGKARESSEELERLTIRLRFNEKEA